MDCADAASAATLVVATEAGKYSLAFGQTYVEIDPALGARITALRVGGSAGADLILDASVNAGTGNADNWGSTFWPSPQSSWSWPPSDVEYSIGAINTSAYAVVADASSVTLTSGVAAKPTVSLTKKLSADLATEAIVIDYTLTNRGLLDVELAPWEITRVAAGGITFYATGMDAPRAGNFPLPLPGAIRLAAGATWFEHDPSDQHDRKLLADGGGGWLAHAAGDLILVKSFLDVPLGAAAEGEAEIEIYAAASAKYVEVEQQGAVQMLTPGAALHWTVRWYARKLPSPATIGSADLVTYVQNLIK